MVALGPGPSEGGRGRRPWEPGSVFSVPACSIVRAPHLWVKGLSRTDWGALLVEGQPGRGSLLTLGDFSADQRRLPGGHGYRTLANERTLQFDLFLIK